MTDRELMQMALDALEWFERREPFQGVRFATEAAEALRARLAQCDAGEICLGCRVCPDEHPEPVAWMNPYGGVLQSLSTGLERSTYTIPLYTTQPQRKWQGLTDEEIKDALFTSGGWREAFRAIEAKLKEKNT